MDDFALDPSDFPALERELRSWPGADRYPDDLQLRRVEIAADALASLPDVLGEVAPGVERVSLVQDEVAMTRRGADVKAWVAALLRDAGFDVDVVVPPAGADGAVHADLETLETIADRFDADRAVVALGTGSITDLAKHSAFTLQERTGRRVPLVFCPTALSVLAFTAQMAVLAKDGVKRTWPSRLSDALIFDLDTICAAPETLNRAGFGDIVPLYSTFADWKLGELLGLATYYEPPHTILEPVRAHLAGIAEGVSRNDPEATAVHTRMNVLGGLSATLAKESSPLSGYEHVCGHMLDMGSHHFGRGMALHGAQVAVAELPHLVGWQILLEELDPAAVDLDACYPSAEVMERRVREVFDAIDPSGKMADECWSDYAQKLAAWSEARPRLEALLADWDAAREQLRPLYTPPEEAVRVLAASGSPLRFDELTPAIPEEEGRWAFTHAHLMRNRLSAGDLYFLLGWHDAGFVDRVFERRDQLVEAARAAR